MKGISHKQAIKWTHRRMDGLLNDGQLAKLEEHLQACDACRAYAIEMNLLPTRLHDEFHARWDKKLEPSQNVIKHVTAKARRIPMTNRISSGIKLFAGVAALLMLGFFINSVVSQLRNTSITATGIEAVNVPPRAEDRLLAFASDQNGNFDIYTIRADGSGLTNLTNNPAQDVSPVWSPDGKRIAFESDRNGFRQIFLMDADGSNVVQLNENEEESDQWIGEPFNLSLNLWSPDGSKLIFYEVALGDENGMLYIIDANGENKKPLVNETGKYSSPSWSPDGKHIAFITSENNVARIYIADANGNNLTNVTKALPSNETLYPMKYSWSRNGQSIVFIASNWNYLLGRGNEGASTYKWTAYEASLDGNTLVANASADSQMGGYWDGTYFLSGSAAVSSSPEFKWVHSDGTSTRANPIENCQKLLDSNTGNYITGYSSYKQSSNGNVVIGAYCPNGDKWLFWANSKGIFIPLLNSPIHVQSIPSNAMHLWAPPDFSWSSDDKYIAFNIFSSGKTDMYIVNVNEALQNPSIQPFHLAIGNNSLYYSPVWQPVINSEVVEEMPKPVPPFNNQLIAFASYRDGNSDIYTMHADGSGLTNLTNNPADDIYPFWSPDSRQIAFASDRDGSMQIYVMNADGSNVVQLTNGEGDYWLDVNGYTPWSPDSRKLIFGHSKDNQDYRLYSMDADGKNKTMLMNEPGIYNRPSWSPDGEHVVFEYYESEARAMARHLFVVDKNGNNLTEITESLPIDRSHFFIFDYYWSQDGTSIFFRADTSKGFDVYQTGLDGSLRVVAKSTGLIFDWWNGTTFQMYENGRSLAWLRSDDSQSTLEVCQISEMNNDLNNGRGLSIVHKRSYSGNLVFGSSCSEDSGWMLYWTNPDGMITDKLLSSPISGDNVTLFNMTWSPDDRFIAFVAMDDSPNLTDILYVLDIKQARKDPSVQPLEMIGSYGPSWQPTP